MVSEQPLALDEANIFHYSSDDNFVNQSSEEIMPTPAPEPARMSSISNKMTNNSGLKSGFADTGKTFSSGVPTTSNTAPISTMGCFHGSPETPTPVTNFGSVSRCWK